MKGKDPTDSGRMFKSPVVEALTRAHISVPLTSFYGVSALVLWWSIARLHLPVISCVALFVVGAFFFTWVEYTVHRYFYHMRTDSPRRTRIQYMFHGVHHDHPRDKKRLALPPIGTLVVAALFIGLFRLVLGPYGFAFGGGFMAGYATYLALHYAIHVYSPPHNFLKAVWKHHNLHHFVGDTAAFGVSSPLWDHVFGTMPEDPLAKRTAKG